MVRFSVLNLLNGSLTTENKFDRMRKILKDFSLLSKYVKISQSTNPFNPYAIKVEYLESGFLCPKNAKGMEKGRVRIQKTILEQILFLFLLAMLSTKSCL